LKLIFLVRPTILA